MRYLTPQNPADAVTALASGEFQILAGGTDVYPALRDRPVARNIIDISRIPALGDIVLNDGWWRIGACVTWTKLIKTPLPDCFAGLKMAAREIGSVHIQNAGTVAGNICNASPAADGVPPLLVLDAIVEVTSLAGWRTVPLADFIIGLRKTVLAEGEMVTAILVAHQPGASTFTKLGARRYLIISIVSGAVLLDVDQAGLIREARIAIGSCSPVAMRLPTLEATLLSQPIGDSALPDIVTPNHFAGLTPIDDVRADAPYRLEAARELVCRMLAELKNSRAEGGR